MVVCQDYDLQLEAEAKPREEAPKSKNTVLLDVDAKYDPRVSNNPPWLCVCQMHESALLSLLMRME